MRICLFLALAFLFSCKNDASKTAQVPALEGEARSLPEGFADFYQKFHGDSLFQVEHIVFPLQGLPDNADSAVIAADNFYWQAETWQVQRPFDFQMSDFERHFEVINENMMVERIVHKSGEFAMVRRFAKVAGEWHLIYYAGMNRLVR